jgi:hypothetical protein
MNTKLPTSGHEKHIRSQLREQVESGIAQDFLPSHSFGYAYDLRKGGKSQKIALRMLRELYGSPLREHTHEPNDLRKRWGCPRLIEREVEHEVEHASAHNIYLLHSDPTTNSLGSLLAVPTMYTIQSPLPSPLPCLHNKEKSKNRRRAVHTYFQYLTETALLSAAIA